jgi:hypothetical protein
MSRYTVVWHQRARELLAEIWLQSSERSAIAAAGDAIDRQLAVDPQLKGIPAFGRIRKLVIPPLNCLFHVEADDRIAHVVLIRRTPFTRIEGTAQNESNGGGHA